VRTPCEDTEGFHPIQRPEHLSIGYYATGMSSVSISRINPDIFSVFSCYTPTT
jgi:hypothetical protein